MSQQWQGPPGQQGFGPPGYGGPPPYQPPYGQIPPKSGSNTLVVVLIVIGVLVVVVGVLASLAIHGMRRYVQSAKTAEAKNTISAMGRSVLESYDRESVSAVAESGGAVHSLCGAATPVPEKVPKGTKYMPSPAQGKDYQTGDVNHGWTCLRYQSAGPSYFQYEYRVGSDYKGPARGGPDPGPDGFEVSAEGDLDGNGVTSLFTLTGKVDKKTHTVHLSDQMFISNEME